MSQLLSPKGGSDARAIVLSATGLESDTAAARIGELRSVWPLVDIVLWAPRATPKLVRAALRAGATDVLLSRSAELCSRTLDDIISGQQLLPRAREFDHDGAQPSTFEGMVSRSRRMWDLFATATHVATTDATVLILGETGTGKELLARAIHARSNRSGQFVGVNCGAVPETLIDSELFGHTRGAFTGAVGEKPGLFRHAEGGTLMLDEVGNVPLPVQYRLLRALQEGAVRPVGAHEEVPVDARVIAATSNALEDDVQNGRFREDLFYRLDVIRLEIPPLRERPEDIIYLFGSFARKVADTYNLQRPDLTEDFLDALVSYDWPGNVRQLQNVTERIVLTQHNRRVSAAQFRKFLPFKKLPQARLSTGGAASPEVEINTGEPLGEALRRHTSRIERAYLDACLRENSGRIEASAKRAGISRRTLLRKMKQYNLDKAQYRS